MLQSILFFVVLTYCFGLVFDLLLKKWDAHFLEKVIVRFGTGILMIPVVGVVFTFLRIPLYWVNFLILTIIILIAYLVFCKPSLKIPKFKLPIKCDTLFFLGLFILFGITAQMYISGSFAYPWLEDGDPYGYATVAKHIAVERTYIAEGYFNQYASPYPQGYSLLIGLMHQTNDSMNWNIKFFNALIVSMSILFFFVFAKKLFDIKAAFFAAFFLLVLPSWVTHFIFSLNFNMSMLFIPLYFLLLTRESKNAKYLFAITYAALLLSHFYTAFIFSVMLAIFYFVSVLVDKSFNKDILDGFLIAVGFSLIFFYIPEIIRHKIPFLAGAQMGGLYGVSKIFQKISGSFFLFSTALFLVVLFFGLYWSNKRWFPYVKKQLSKKYASLIIYSLVFLLYITILVVPDGRIFYAKGTADRAYVFKDFFSVPEFNLVNNPTGIGALIMSLYLLGLLVMVSKHVKLFEKKNFSRLLLISWSIYVFMSMMAYNFSIAISPFRMWTFFAFLVALGAGYFLSQIFLYIKKRFHGQKRMLIYLALVAVVLVGSYTPFTQKYITNTMMWQDHMIFDIEAIKLYAGMMDAIPKDSMVYPICNFGNLPNAFDMLSPVWEELIRYEGAAYYGEKTYTYVSMYESLEENYKFLKERGYEYVIIGVDCILAGEDDAEVVTDRAMEMLESEKFQPVLTTDGASLFRVI